jgi:hypothetical protein
MDPGEILSRGYINFLEPSCPFCIRAGHDHRKHAPVKYRNPAERKDASAPERFQRVAKDLIFPLLSGICGVEDKGSLCLEKTDRDPLAVVAFTKPVRDTGSDDAVDPPFQDGGGLTPPVGMDDDNAIRFLNLPAMLRDERVERCVPGDLIVLQHRVEPLDIEIVEMHGMTVIGKRLHNGFCDSVVEASRPGMGEDNEDVQTRTFPVALKNV